MSFLKELQNTKKSLDQISPSFCLAKWLQVTLHLQSGHNHSCHHPNTHYTPLSEIKDNYSALHNTKLKKSFRKQMLNGIRPAECEYCWKVEDLKGRQTSDRHIKSNDFWAKPYLNHVLKTGPNGNIAPRYMEVSFSHKCNFKCIYCLPHVSSAWMDEIEKFGPYRLSYDHQDLKPLVSNNQMPYREELTNPYVQAFWKWWPEVSKELQVFRITGGEPLLSESTFRILENIKEIPLPQLELAINSNLGIPTDRVDRLIRRVNDLLKEKAIKSFRIYTSLDTWGNQASYIRTGLKPKLFRRNFSKLFEQIPGLSLTIMVTFNILSIPQFIHFLKATLRKKKQLLRTNQELIIDISYLSSPHFLSFINLPKINFRYLAAILEFMDKNSNKNLSWGFSDYEIEKMRRLVKMFESSKVGPVNYLSRSNFVCFIDELDNRRKTSFLGAFPEFEQIYLGWKNKDVENEKIPFIHC